MDASSRRPQFCARRMTQRRSSTTASRLDTIGLTHEQLQRDRSAFAHSHGGAGRQLSYYVAPIASAVASTQLLKAFRWVHCASYAPRRAWILSVRTAHRSSCAQPWRRVARLTLRVILPRSLRISKVADHLTRKINLLVSRECRSITMCELARLRRISGRVGYCDSSTCEPVNRSIARHITSPVKGFMLVGRPTIECSD